MGSVVAHGLSCPTESSQIRDQTHVPHIGRWILKHWTTKEVFFSFTLKCTLYKILITWFHYWAWLIRDFCVVNLQPCSDPRRQGETWYGRPLLAWLSVTTTGAKVLSMCCHYLHSHFFDVDVQEWCSHGHDIHNALITVLLWSSGCSQGCCCRGHCC